MDKVMKWNKKKNLVNSLGSKDQLVSFFDSLVQIGKRLILSNSFQELNLNFLLLNDEFNYLFYFLYSSSHDYFLFQRKNKIY